MQNNHEIIQMAWCDKTSFEDIYFHTGYREKDVINLMRKSLKPSGYRLWRKRVYFWKTNHYKLFLNINKS